jgi:hypothetical protein
MAASYTPSRRPPLPREGTGSSPPLPNGLHRATLDTAISEPRTAPWVRTASSAYREQVGEYRHCPPSHPESVSRYTAMAPKKRVRTGAPAIQSTCRSDLTGAAPHARATRSSPRSDPGFGRPGWPLEPPGRCRVLPSLAAPPHGAPPEGPASLGSAPLRHRPSCRRPARTLPSRARQTVPSAFRGPSGRPGRPAAPRRFARRRSAGDGQTAPALPTASRQDRPACPRPHPVAEAVPLRPSSGVRLIGALSFGHRGIPRARNRRPAPRRPKGKYTETSQGEGVDNRKCVKTPPIAPSVENPGAIVRPALPRGEGAPGDPPP